MSWTPPPGLSRRERRYRAIGLTIGLVCVPVSGILGWVLLIAALGGNWWATAGLALVLTSAAAIGFLYGLFSDTEPLP